MERETVGNPTQQDRNGQELSNGWTEEELVHMYKGKGAKPTRWLPTNFPTTGNIQNMAQLTNKQNLEILQISSCNNPYGYKEGLSTIEEIAKIEYNAKPSETSTKYRP